MAAIRRPRVRHLRGLDLPPPTGSKSFIVQTKFQHNPTFFTPASSSGSEPESSADHEAKFSFGSDDELALSEITANPLTNATTYVAGQCNDGDGYGDRCDERWFPHPEFNGLIYDHSARVEHGRVFQLLGDVVFCSAHRDTLSMAVVVSSPSSRSNVSSPFLRSSEVAIYHLRIENSIRAATWRSSQPTVARSRMSRFIGCLATQM